MTQQNSLIHTVQPVFDYIIGLRIRLDKNPGIPVQIITDEITKLFDNLEKRLTENPIKVEEKVKSTKHALTALIDDVLIKSNWEYIEDWKDNPWESQYLKTYRSETKIKEIIENSNESDLAELLYICYSLGLKKDDEKTVPNKQKMYSLIQGRLDSQDKFLPYKQIKTSHTKLNRLPPMFGFYIFGIVLIVFTISYLFASQWLWNDAAEIISDMGKLLKESGY